ncbi:MAG TPA: TonB-dependent receptor [Terriglobales bacterium]|nr:TonB-dependent receptor [Terriglobales bacterium]
MLKRAHTGLLIVLFSFTGAVAQQSVPPSAARQNAIDTQTVIVTGSFEPIPLQESNRWVVSFNTQQYPLLYDSFVDYLSQDSSVDLQQRAPGGVQADLSIRGSTFEQSLVLLNGLRINDAQSGHHNMDIPVPLDSISTIEVLHGTGSTFYGADAIGGVVNFITAPPEASEIRIGAGLGNFGFNQQRFLGTYVARRWSEEIAADRDFSTGFIPDRDYRSSAVSSETRFKTALGRSDILFAGSDRPFGAAGFYGDFPSWERTKSWYASGNQQLGSNTTLAFAYRRHSDEFVLFRNDPAIYENNHVSQSWEAALRRINDVGRNSSLAYGLEADGDKIDSNNLGHHARNRTAGYVSLDLRALRRFAATIGGREEVFSGGRTEFAPTVAGGVWLGRGWRVRASVSRGFRLPTYTDLYYSDPANLGNPLLKPESAWDFEGGPEWNTDGNVSAQLTVFQRRLQDGIDYIKYAIDQPWQATNIDSINYSGVEASSRLRLPHLQELGFSYTYLHANQQSVPGLISQYVFNYASNNGVFAWSGTIKRAVNVRNRVGVTQRIGRDAYPLWDFATARADGRVRPYLQFSNLSNTGYEDIPGVPMPGRMVIGGMELVFAKKN